MSLAAAAVFGIGTANGKRHWDAPGWRAVAIAQKFGSRGVDVFGGNEFDEPMYRALLDVEDLGVVRGKSNAEHGGWVGNIIAWDRGTFDLDEFGQLALRFRYWPAKRKAGRRFKWFRPMTIHLPWVRLRHRQSGVVFMVLAIHLPTRFNAKPRARRRLQRAVRGWLRRREVPALVVGDGNDAELFVGSIDVVTVARAGVDLVVGSRQEVRVLDGGNRIDLAGLSDHDAAWGRVQVTP